MSLKRSCLSMAVVAVSSGFIGVTHADDVQPFPGSRINLAPLPAQIYMQPGEKPVLTFSTPCMQIERMTNGFPPIVAFENFMFTMIGNVNQSGLLPLKVEPVCI